MVMNDKHLKACKEGKIRALNRLTEDGTIRYSFGFIIDSNDMKEQIKSVVSKTWKREVTDFETLPYGIFAVTMGAERVIVAPGSAYLTSPFTKSAEANKCEWCEGLGMAFSNVGTHYELKRCDTCEIYESDEEAIEALHLNEELSKKVGEKFHRDVKQNNIS